MATRQVKANTSLNHVPAAGSCRLQLIKPSIQQTITKKIATIEYPRAYGSKGGGRWQMASQTTFGSFES